MNSLARPQLHQSPIFWLIVLTCLFPVAVGGALYFFDWRPQNNQLPAFLVQPPLLVNTQVSLWRESPASRNLKADETLAGRAGGRWILMTACSGHDTTCPQLLDAARRVHVATANNYSRVMRLWLVAEKDDASIVSPVMTKYPDLLVLSSPEQWVKVADFATPALYVLDPNGRIVLRYSGPFTLASTHQFLKNFKTLLRNSWNG